MPRKRPQREAAGAKAAGTREPRDRTSYALLCLSVVCQAITIVIAWPAWNVRQDPVTLPLIPLPQISFGIPLLVSLAAVLIWPQRGLFAHATVYALACVFDQTRLQPQLLSLIVLMLACVHDTGTWLARWYLASMWLWAGLHKFLSREWLGEQSWHFLHECGVTADDWHSWFALAVAGCEVALGLMAAWMPRRAAVACLVLHLGILLSLSPLLRNFNPSVWPWNLATAVVGVWILRREVATPASWLPRLVVVSLLVIPGGYYLDLVNPHLAFVLYSGHMPQALHVSKGSPRRLDGWTGLPVPFPDSPRLLLESFRRTAQVGDKLHIDDPRFGLQDRYFVMQPDRTVREISQAVYLRRRDDGGEVAGSEIEDRHAVWRLSRQGVVLERGPGQLVVAASLTGNVATREMLAQITALPNLHTLRISGGRITGDGLIVLKQLPRLQLLEIKECQVGDTALAHIAESPELRWLHLERTPVASVGLASLAALDKLEVLLLPQTGVDDTGLAHLSDLDSLEWLDLAQNPVSSGGLAALKNLSRLEWIKLHGTQVDDDGMRQLASLVNLRIVELSSTSIGDTGIEHLSGLRNLEQLNLEGTQASDAALESLASLGRLRYLNLRNTHVSPDAVARLAAILTECRIDH